MGIKIWAAVIAAVMTGTSAQAGDTWGQNSDYGVNVIYGTDKSYGQPNVKTQNGVNVIYGTDGTYGQDAPQTRSGNAAQPADVNVNVTVNVNVINVEPERSFSRSRLYGRRDFVSIGRANGDVINVLRKCDRKWKITRDRYGREKRILKRTCKSLDGSLRYRSGY